MNKIDNETISFLLEEEEDKEEKEDKDEKENINYLNLLNEMEYSNILKDDFQFPKLLHYSENFTLKELFLICEYYGFLKDVKANKCNKEVIIQILVDFESNPANFSIVNKRINLWFYMNELKNDKFMKKFVLW